MSVSLWLMFVPIVNELFIQAGADDAPGVGPDVGPDQNGPDPELENMKVGGG